MRLNSGQVRAWKKTGFCLLAVAVILAVSASRGSSQPVPAMGTGATEFATLSLDVGLVVDVLWPSPASTL